MKKIKGGNKVERGDVEMSRGSLLKPLLGLHLRSNHIYLWDRLNERFQCTYRKTYSIKMVTVILRKPAAIGGNLKTEKLQEYMK